MSDAQHQTALSLFGQGRHAEGIQLLGHAAESGHVPSMSLLGGQLLAGRGARPDPVAGIRWTMAAAERGDGSACATAGMLWASGLAGAPDWPRALDYLERAAGLGFAPAQAQLRLLAGNPRGTDWTSLRRAVDIDAWRRGPEPQTLSEDPLIHVTPGLLTPELCDLMIAVARARLGPARIYDELSGGLAVRDARRNSAAEFTVADMDLVLLAVRERLCGPTGLPALNADGFQVLHYKVGERFTPHFDFLDPQFKGNALAIAQSGQRVATVLVYLNEEGLQGGETDFPRLGLRHRGARGDALMFRNLDSQGQPDRRTLHAGLSPTAGEKWLLTQWVRDRTQPGVGDPQLVAALNGR
jgi:hypothetical protein